MSEFSTPLPSGMRVRDIKTKLVGGKVVADLDAQGREQELTVVHVPLAIEAAGGGVIAGFVADIQAKGADIALVRATAAIEQADPAAAETAFLTAQQAGNVAADAALGDAIAAVPAAGPGGTV